MIKHLLPAIILLAPTSTISAVDVTLDYSIIQTNAAFGPLISSNNAPLTYPGNQSVVGQQPHSGSIARAQLDYEAVDSNKSATFDFEVDLQGTHTEQFHHSNARTKVYLNFTLTEPLAYSVTGVLDCATDIPGVEFQGHWELFGYSTEYFYFKESKIAWDSSTLEADDLPDLWSSDWSSDRTGILPVGSYNLYFVARLDTTNAPGSTAYLKGFTNLTLSRLVPEPNSVLLIAPIVSTALATRSIRREHACL